MNGVAVGLLALARAAPLLASLALSGCAPVGPNFERPAAIVSPQFKEIKGWKIATPRANEPKGEWWSVFRDPELDQLMRVVVVSNQTIKADEANYRRGAGAHQRGARRPLSDCRGDWLRDALFALADESDRGSLGDVDARRLGPGPARDRGAAGRR